MKSKQHCLKCIVVSVCAMISVPWSPNFLDFSALPEKERKKIASGKIDDSGRGKRRKLDATETWPRISQK
jgi:hypothetical protein